MKWLKQLFGVSNPVKPVVEPLRKTTPVKPPAAAHEERVSSPTEFSLRALIGPTRCQLPIKDMAEVAGALAKALGDSGISNDGILKLLDYGLIGVCPRCNQYCAGKAIFMLKTFSLMGSVMFTGNSGGAERLMDGKCSNYSCENTTFELFWCPDLDPGMLANLHSRGIRIDPHTQQHRDPYWKPKR